MENNKRKAFTLVELIAVISILGMIILIAVPKVNKSILSNKKETFLVNARNIIRQLEYDNLDFISFKKMPLKDLELNKFLDGNIDKDNSMVYEVDNSIFLDLVGINKYKDLYLCGVSNQTKEIKVQNTPCDNEHNLIYIDFVVDLDGGSTSQNFNTKYLSGNYLVLEIPKKTNDTFLGWELVSGNSILDQNRIKFGTENTKIKALWGNNPELVVNLNGGTSSQKFDSKYSGGSLIILQEPTREGYKFKGWNLVVGNAILSGNVLTTGTTNTVIEAIWELSEFNISYELNGGTKGENAPSKGKGGSSIIISNPTKLGYTFKGWDVIGTGSSISGTILTMGSQDVILVANWELNVYTISYNLNGGTLDENAPKTATYGSTVTVSNPTREGYIFNGWDLSGNEAVLSGTNLTIGDGNVTLTAKWNKTPVLATNYPQDKTVVIHNSVTSEVVISETGIPDSYTYQWYNSSGIINGATSSSYTFTPTSTGTTTLYCKVTNSAGSVTTRTATITATGLYLYNYGNEYGDITGGWAAKDGSAYVNRGITKNASNIVVSIQKYDGRDGQESVAATGKVVNVSNYAKLRIVVSNFSNTNSDGVSKNDNVCLFGLYSSSVNSPTVYKRVSANGTLDLDISAYSGNYYVFFGCSNSWISNNSDYSKFTVSSVELI